MFERFYAESQTFRDNIHLLRRIRLRAFLHHLIDEKSDDEEDQNTHKDTGTLMATNTATDDQVFTQVFSQTDSDKVPVDGSSSPVTVQVVDSTGADVSKWINVAQDAVSPLKFTYTRKADDGTQPQNLAFTSIGTATVAGAPTEFKADFEFTPGAAASLTSTITVGSATPAEGSATAEGTAP